MGNDNSQQRFAEAKKLYVEGKYEKALLHLRQLEKRHPDVFNIQHPILQCLQHLGKVGEVQDLVDRMKGIYPEEKHQAKLRRVERWIKRTEGQTVTTAGNTAENTTGNIKDGQIESDFEDKMEDRIESSPGEPVAEQESVTDSKNGKASEKVPATPDEPPESQTKQDKIRVRKSESKKHPVLRTLLIVCEVIFIVLVGSAVMYFLSTKTTRVLPEFTADVIMEVNETQITGKLYLKNADTFRMEIMEQIFIASNGQVRKILTEEEKYINVNPSDVERYNPLVGLSNFGDWVRINNAKKVGRETLNGFVCDIYEASVSGADNTPSMSTKVWYCRQIKFPLKSENSAPELNGKISVTLENVKTEESLPAIIFEVPAVYAEFVKKKEKEPDPNKLDALPDNMEALLEAGDPTALLMQFQ